jgi:hypothetical protein
MMRSDEVPCGKSTFTFRSYVRITDMDMKKAVYSPEAVASYTRHC